MIVEHDKRRAGGAYESYGEAGYPRRADGVRRFLGGSPAAVFVRLLFLSVLVGAVMAMFGLTPGQLFWHAYDSARALADLAFGTMHEFGAWILAGAIVVVPLWFISRLFAVSK